VKATLSLSGVRTNALPGISPPIICGKTTGGNMYGVEKRRDISRVAKMTGGDLSGRCTHHAGGACCL